ncbi:aminotransferase class V-fold PLP-dependent enzyme [Labedaea rhizosphaerae]|uniref:Isopenicillin-N epimerase n=1 Tax=Labedaea rhizosphaerae TaxID=598644 RepID=A0A4R6SKI7_LABRH|nr:aminotransferase class V-fold PLP-dependent enzyme [Labedaea rhizosphaerae]TDQ01558.1 isopenicillin-N epimerase [Labedaea rhizosphaerae]
MSAELFSLDPSVVHANNGSFGAVPLVVQQAQAAIKARAEANPVRFFRVEQRELVATARTAAAEFLGVDDGLVLVSNVTTGVATVLAALELGEGDEIVVSDHGYGAVSIACEARAARVGAAVRTAPVPLTAERDATVQAFADALTPRTKLVVVDAITSLTAMVFPVAEIAKLCHEQGVAVFVDAAHAPGQLPDDPESTGADFWVGNFHKWAYAARGTAGLWLAPQWRDRIPPLVPSWAHPAGFPDAYSDVGTDDLSAWASLPTALEFWRAQGGWDAVRRSAALADKAVEVVAAALGAPGQVSPRHTPLMRLVPLPDGLVRDAEDANRYYDELSTRHRVETTISWWGGHCYVRLSSHLYNKIEDYEKVAAALLEPRR